MKHNRGKKTPAQPIGRAVHLEAWEATCLSWFTVGLAAVVLLYRRWGVCPDLIVDFGREVYVPWRLAEGQDLYTEVAYFNGPLSPYWNAVWFRLFGPSIACIAVANSLVLAVFLWITYRVLQLASNRLVAWAGTLTIVLIFAFGHYVGIGNYNFIYPYSHEMTHGVALSMAALYCCFLYCAREDRRFLVLAGFFAGLVFLTKPEIFLALAVALAAGLTISACIRLPEVGLAELGMVAASALAAPLAAFAMLCVVMPVGAAWIATLGGWVYVFNDVLVSQSYFDKFMGTDDIAASTGSIAIWTVLECAAFGAAAFVAWLVPAGRATRVAMVVAAALAMMGLSWAFRIPLVDSALLPLPLLLLVAGCWRGWALGRSRSDPAGARRIAAQLVLIAFGLTMLLKILLRVQVTHYGFALSVIGVLIVTMAALDWIPAAIRARGGCGEVFQAAWMAAVLVFVVTCLQISQLRIEEKVVRVGAGADSLVGYRQSGRGTAVILKEIAARSRPDETLLVVPEGVMINYLARRVNPTPFINFVPTELETHGEDRMLAAIEAHPPDWIVWVPRPMHDYGKSGFDIDYGLKLGTWIREQYEAVGPLKDSAGFELLRRK